MKELTRRRLNVGFESWGVFYADVRVGGISRRSGVPDWVDPWAWSCGFTPGCGPGETISGTAATFDLAKVEFEKAWKRLASIKSEDHFQEWRDFRDFTEWKYTMWGSHLPLPTQTTTGVSKCFCGAEISMAQTETHIRAVHAQSA